MFNSLPRLIKAAIILSTITSILANDEGYLRYVKEGCFLRGEAMSCIKYKALKLATKTILGHVNDTVRANKVFSLVPLDQEMIVEDSSSDLLNVSETRGLLSEWTELTKFAVKLVKDFFKRKGLRIDLPEGARTIEDEEEDDAERAVRGRKKKLAILIPLLTLVAAVKAKLLLIPILLSVLLIKKLLLLGALLVPSLLHTLKMCKMHHHHAAAAPPSYSFFGNSDSSDYSSGFGNQVSYSSSGGYNKDWASNRAYNAPVKIRGPPANGYITAPGTVA